MTMIKARWPLFVVGCILLGGVASFAFDKTQPPWPQLSTSHGPIRPAETIKDAINGHADFLVTDMPLTDAELQHARDARGVRLLHIATAVTAVVPCYNVAGVSMALNFDSDLLAAVFLERITKWNDPAIVALNPTAHLPPSDILIIGHAVEDGSTYAWTDFLTKTSAEWKRRVGRVRSLMGQPVLAGGQSAEDIARIVKATPNSIAYSEMWAAKSQNLQIGRVRNRSGRYIEASPASVGAAAQAAVPAIRDDFRTSITDTTGPNNYPIASFTWIVIPDNFRDAEKVSVVTGFLKWVLTEGQGSTDVMHLVRLPRSIAVREIHLLQSVR